MAYISKYERERAVELLNMPCGDLGQAGKHQIVMDLLEAGLLKKKKGTKKMAKAKAKPAVKKPVKKTKKK